MSLLRTSTIALRRAAVPAAVGPSTMAAARGYADKPDGEFSEAYRRGQSSGFSKREQASEDQFVREAEQAKLKALRDKLNAQRKHLDDVEAAIDDLHKPEKK